MNNYKVGLLGYGMGGRVFHAPLIAYTDGLELVKIRETREPNIALATERYPNATIVSTSDDILNDPEIDLVVLAIPNKHHFSVAKEALNAGKNVVVEKPFTVTSDEASELIRLAQKTGKLLTVFHNRRWDSDFLTVQQVINGNKLGRLVEYEAHYDRFRNNLRPSTWKEEGEEGNGLLYDLGSHLIDQALMLFGTPKEVTGFLLSQRDNSRIVDNFEVILHYNSLKVTLKSGMLVHGKLPKYTLLGTEGAFIKYGLDVQEAALNEGITPEIPDWGHEPNENWGELSYETEEGRQAELLQSLPGNYPAFYKNIAAVLAGKEEVSVKAEEARNTIRVIELAIQSNRERCTKPFAMNH